MKLHMKKKLQKGDTDIMNYLPLTPQDMEEMLKKINVSSVDNLFSAIPPELRVNKFDFLPESDELSTAAHIADLGMKNRKACEAPCFLGAGAYDHFIPAAIDALTSRGEFYTAYTPYQPEASQGTLQAIFEFQSMISALTAMDCANASMYDGATALAEAVLMAVRHTGKNTVLYPDTLHPQYLRVLKTYLTSYPVSYIELPSSEGKIDLDRLSKADLEQSACFILQNPNFYGIIEDGHIISKTISGKTMLIVCADPNSLGLLDPPGHYQASICVGDCQPLGLPAGFGGPYAGFLAVEKSLMRKMPGRLVGKTADLDGKTGFVLTLQAREQHIRRDKATSNICTNQALCALRSTIYLSLLGKQGLSEAASISYSRAHLLAAEISKIPGFKLRYKSPFYKEFLVDCPVDAKTLTDSIFNSHSILAGIPMSHFDKKDTRGLLIAVTEKRTIADIESLIKALSSFGRKS